MALLTATAIIVASCLWYATKYRICFGTVSVSDWPICAVFVLATYATVYCLVHEIGPLFIWANTVLFLFIAGDIFVDGDVWRNKVFSAVCVLNIFFFTGELKDDAAVSRVTTASIGLALAFTIALVFVYDRFICRK